MSSNCQCSLLYYFGSLFVISIATFTYIIVTNDTGCSAILSRRFDIIVFIPTFCSY